MEKQIFELYDRVFDYRFGWGIVSCVNCEGPLPLLVLQEGNQRPHHFTIDGRIHELQQKTLSFVEYDLINGGFTQDRPLPIIKQREVVYVRFINNPEWYMRHFHKFINGNMHVYCGQKKDYETEIAHEWSLENPLLNKK